ncbi:MAG: GMC family oxidoreductase N-terminal domain-containing protein [Candidatus Aminicenantes bacterium]|nr:GMC family oxidoreductase N-terminal domain-containing protein [Candidatus Aminicenantes bacterium]
MKTAIVVGSGAGGAAAARELQGRFNVTILEAGPEFRPFGWSLRIPTAAKRARLLFDVREISLLFPAMKIDRAGDGMIHVRGIGTGGTTTLATGNGLRLDHDLKALGIDLGPEFDDLGREVPITTDHRRLWRRTTRELFAAAEAMGLDPRPTPKMGRHEHCRNCGRCVLGCPYGVKWDSREFLKDALAKGAKLETGAHVERLEMRGGEAAGVRVRRGLRSRFMPADVTVLAAGGLGTPVILAASGFPGEPRLFVDPVLCVAARRPGAGQNAELPMPFYAQRDGYMISPYFDHLSYFFNRRWTAPAGDILSLMIKLADQGRGSIERRRLRKTLTPEDRAKLAEATGLCEELFGRLGIPKNRLFLGTLNAGHPGGMYPLTRAEAKTFHHDRLPGNVFLVDASLLPAALGRPPILTILALAKAVARKIPS